jgi:ribosomal protein S18 acetylase RimI-like enzyme
LNILNRPAYSALKSRQANFAQSHGAAIAFAPEFAAFAALENDSEQAWQDLAKLEIGNDGFWLLEQNYIGPKAGFYVDKTAHCKQMIFDHEVIIENDVEVVELNQNDAKEMHELALLCQPGPFFARTNELAQFIGIKIDGRLVSMMGERLQIDGFSELSALATHPDFQGKKWGKYLLNQVTKRILARGQIPFLHVYAWNEIGIKNYENLGFRVRTDIYVSVLKKK